MPQIVVFDLDELRIGLPFPAVERVVRAVSVTPLPGAAEIVPGIIDLQGRVLPVIDLRRRLGLPAREIRLSDQLIVARAGRRAVALWVDAVRGVVHCADSEIIAADSIVPGLDHITGILKLRDGLLLLENLGTALSLDEERALARALEAA